MSPGTVVLTVLFALVVITIFMGVRLVPQGYEFVVQRLGKYHSTLKPGLNFIIPYVDIVAYRLTTKDIPLEIGAQEAITKDPSKAADLTAKVQAVTTKYQGATTLADACKAYDEVTAAIKG